MKTIFFLLLTALCVFLGCALNKKSANTKNGEVFATPKSFYLKIKTADLIIVTNAFDEGFLGKEGVGFKIQGHDASNLIAIIGKLKSYPLMGGMGSGEMDMLFYSGTNLLAKACTQGKVFNCENGQFVDDSGVIDGIYGIWLNAVELRFDQWEQQVLIPKIRNLERQQTSHTNR